MANGKVVQVIGPVLDVEFPADAVPEIYNALTLEDASGDVPVRLTAEVQQHIGRNQVRAVAMSTTDGLVRGTPVENTGAPIAVPVGACASLCRAGRRRCNCALARRSTSSAAPS